MVVMRVFFQFCMSFKDMVSDTWMLGPLDLIIGWVRFEVDKWGIDF